MQNTTVERVMAGQRIQGVVVVVACTKIPKYQNTKIPKYQNTQIQEYKNTRIQEYKNTKYKDTRRWSALPLHLVFVSYFVYFSGMTFSSARHNAVGEEGGETKGGSTCN